MVVADENLSLEVTGNGDVLESHDGIIGVGSGGSYAVGQYISSSSSSHFEYTLLM